MTAIITILTCHGDASFVSTDCGAIFELHHKKMMQAVLHFTTVVLLQSTDASYLGMTSKSRYGSSRVKAGRGCFKESSTLWLQPQKELGTRLGQERKEMLIVCRNGKAELN